MSDSQARVRCYSHHVDEAADRAFEICGECFHVYRTAGELRREYRRGMWQAFAGVGLRHRVKQVLSVRTSKIYFCPHCLHDF